MAAYTDAFCGSFEPDDEQWLLTFDLKIMWYGGASKAWFTFMRQDCQEFS